MSANLEAKKVQLEEIKDKLSRAKTIVFVDYKTINTKQDYSLRVKFRKAGAEYKVYKNKLVLRGLNELGIAGCEKMLEGTNAIGFGYEDEIAPAKLLVEEGKAMKKLPVVFGIHNKKVVDKTYIEALAAIPSREVLIARLLGMLQAPTQKLAATLAEVAKKA